MLLRLPRWTPPGFNEAAGIPRGRLYVDSRVVGVAAASMRPRVFPAEDDVIMPGATASDALQ